MNFFGYELFVLKGTLIVDITQINFAIKITLIESYSILVVASSLN